MIDTSDSTPKSVSRKRRSIGRTAASILVVVLIVGFVAARLIGRHPTPPVRLARATHFDKIAPGGTFTTTSGHTANLDSYIGGHSTMVWFIAGGCASCAASIPAVVEHMHQLNGEGVRVVILGLYGAFYSGRQGATQLADFGSAASGMNITRLGWTWGVASEALSMAYDSSGTPDEYVLVAPNSQIVYQNSVPVSTMSQLLTAAARVRTERTEKYK